MDTKKLTSDYHTYKQQYQQFQVEIEEFARAIIEKHKDFVDIDDIRQRPKNEIKSLKSILENVRRDDKYKKVSNLFDIKDISAIRVTCCCEDDYNQLDSIIEAELNKSYLSVQREKKGQNNQGKSQPDYRAIHYNFTKNIAIDGNSQPIIGEIQLRTVMGNAWAILHRQYVYGTQKEGESTELTSGTATIMEGCEKIWSVVKKNRQAIDKKEPLKLDLSFTSEVARELKQLTSPKDVTKWLNSHRTYAVSAMERLHISGYVDIEIKPLSTIKDQVSKRDLMEIARKSQIHTFGWPIGVYLDREEARPVIDVEGIHAEVSPSDFGKVYDNDDKVYDYWAIHQQGSFYSRTSLFEDTREDNIFYFNTRIVRITEILMYARNLYKQLKLANNTPIELKLVHGGLKGRRIKASTNRIVSGSYVYRSNDSELPVTNIFTMSDIDKDATAIVEKFVSPLFEMFDGFEVGHQIIEDIVVNYMQGKVT